MIRASSERSERMRRLSRVLGLVVALAGLARCASHPPPTPPAGSGLPPPAAAAPLRAPERLEDAEAGLLALEDRRTFDEPALAAAARSPDPRIRARAALALGRIGDERASRLLAGSLADPDPGVRAAAAFASGILGEPALTANLAPLLGDPDSAVASRAAWSLGFLEGEAGEAALVAAIPGARTPELRTAFLWALWHFPTPRAAAAAMAHAASPEPAVRAAGLYALARRPQESSRAVLTLGLSDSDLDTAIACARGLGVLGNPESLEALSAAMFGPRAPAVVWALTAARAILEKNPSAALAPATGARLLALSGDADPNLAIPALALLRWFPADREVFRRLWAVAGTGRGRRRAVALEALMGALGEKAEPLADAAISGADPFLRASVAESLSLLPEADATARRERLASDPEIVVRLKVLEGLKTPADARNSRAIVDILLKDPDPGIRAAAIEALALGGDPAALRGIHDAVVASYGDAAADVGIEAIDVASKRPESAEARSIAEAAYRHPSPVVSRLARRALVRVFRAGGDEFPLREYSTGKTPADYAALSEEARRPADVRIDTERGAFTIRLAGSEAPLTVTNFRKLARAAYFDGARIHRVVPGYVVQDGDPGGTGNGGPGYEIRDEINTLSYGAGTVGMALAGPDTGGSQWFVTMRPQPQLDGTYTAFGQVVEGMDVVNRIEQGDRILGVRVARESR
jgi:cyclophilin family peptidyl-prolyl cis-trans isomerase/HEAT repeat protein